MKCRCSSLNLFHFIHSQALLLCLVLFFHCGIFPLSHARAESTNPPTQKIIVSATRSSDSGIGTGSRADIWESEDFSAATKWDMKGLLQKSAGVQTNSSGGPGQSSTLFIRGANSEHTLFLLDGMELNEPITPTRNFDYSQLSLQGMERVEILRGPQSVLYGSSALGGLVLLEQKRGRGPWQGSIRGSYGSHDTWQSGASLSRGNSRWHIFQDIDFMQTAGISAADSRLPGNTEKDGTRRISHSLKAGYQLSEKAELQWSSRWLQAKIASDNFGGAFGDNAFYSTRLQQFFSRLSYKYNTEGGYWLGAANFSLHDRRTETPARSSFYSTHAKAEAQRKISLAESWDLTMGLDAQSEKGKSTDLPEPQKSFLHGVYSQIIWSPEKFVAVGGLRYDGHDRFGQAYTQRFTFITRDEILRPHATIGNAFRAPSLYQLYARPYGNSALRPERSLGWDAGIELGNYPWRADFTFFKNTFRDLIGFDNNSRYSNISTAATYGLESTVQRDWHNQQIRIVHTWLRAFDRQTQRELLRRPRHSISAQWEIRFAGFRQQIEGRYLGIRQDIDELGNRVKMPGFASFNYDLRYSFKTSGELFFSAQNLLDRKYQEIRGYGTTGRSFYFGFEWPL